MIVTEALQPQLEVHPPTYQHQGVHYQSPLELCLYHHSDLVPRQKTILINQKAIQIQFLPKEVKF